MSQVIGFTLKKQSPGKPFNEAFRLRFWPALLGSLCCLLNQAAYPQAAVRLPNVAATSRAGAIPFQFVSDAPPGQGWGLGDSIARFYAKEQLPAFFSRTIVLDGDVPR